MTFGNERERLTLEELAVDSLDVRELLFGPSSRPANMA